MMMILIGIVTSIISFAISQMCNAEPVGAFFMCLMGGIMAAVAYGAWREKKENPAQWGD